MSIDLPVGTPSSPSKNFRRKKRQIIIRIIPSTYFSELLLFIFIYSLNVRISPRHYLMDQLTASGIWVSHHKIGACAERLAGCKEYFADGVYSAFELFAGV